MPLEFLPKSAPLPSRLTLRELQEKWSESQIGLVCIYLNERHPVYRVGHCIDHRAPSLPAGSKKKKKEIILLINLKNNLVRQHTNYFSSR